MRRKCLVQLDERSYRKKVQRPRMFFTQTLVLMILFICYMRVQNESDKTDDKTQRFKGMKANLHCMAIFSDSAMV